MLRNLPSFLLLVGEMQRFLRQRAAAQAHHLKTRFGRNIVTYGTKAMIRMTISMITPMSRTLPFRHLSRRSAFSSL